MTEKEIKNKLIESESPIRELVMLLDKPMKTTTVEDLLELEDEEELQKWLTRIAEGNNRSCAECTAYAYQLLDIINDSDTSPTLRADVLVASSKFVNLYQWIQCAL